MSSQHDTTKQRKVLFLNFDLIVANDRARLAYGYPDDPPIYADTMMIECLKRAIYRRPIQIVIVNDPWCRRPEAEHKKEVFTLLGDLSQHVHEDWSVPDHSVKSLKTWMEKHPNFKECAIADDIRLHEREILEQIPQMHFFPGDRDGLPSNEMKSLLDWARVDGFRDFYDEINIMKRAEKKAASRKAGERPFSIER